MAFELLIRNGLVVDPHNGVHGLFDVGVSGGKVETVAPGLEPQSNTRVVDATGKLVMPGIVDAHVHMPGRGGVAHHDMARNGVTTAVEFSSFRRMLAELPAVGAGLCVAGLEILGPYVDEQPSLPELERLVDEVVADGALGIKISGGHYPSTPAATARMIQAANNRAAYVAYHVGTTETGSQMTGYREAFELAGRNRMHMTHINAYVRGMVRPPLEETVEALELLTQAYWMVSESHLGPRNSTGGPLGPDGQPADWVTRNCLRMRGYELSRDGMEQAFRDGYVALNIQRGGRTVQIFGDEALEIWRAATGDTRVSFPVNLRSTALICATARARQADGRRDFAVDAICTDGGSWRNLIPQNGLALVRFGALTLDEFVSKVSLRPARMFGMMRKGHLSPGADADISILDTERLAADATVVGGQVVMINGTVTGSGATIVCTSRGRDALQEKGFETQIVNIEESLYWTKGDHDPGPREIEVV